MKEALGFKNIVEWKKIDSGGNVVDSGILENQVQTLVKERVIDALDTGTLTSAIAAMAVGTGTNQDAAAAALASKASDEDLSAQTQPTSTSLQNVASFTKITGTITEAGLFDATGCTDDMYFYNDGLNVALTATDTLQITWTVNCTGT